MFMTQWGEEGQHPKQVILNGPGMMGGQGNFRAVFFSIPLYFQVLPYRTVMLPHPPAYFSLGDFCTAETCFP